MTFQRGAVILFLFCVSIPISQAGQSNSLMDISPDGKSLLVTNSDNGTVTVVDLNTRKALREIIVGNKPESVTWIGNGPTAVATVYREDKLVFFDAEKGNVLKELIVDDEPYGIITNKAGTRAWVTHEYPGLVSELDLKAMKVINKFPVGSYVRGISIAPDEKRLYVTEFYNGILHAVDLSTNKVVDSWKGHSTANLCRQVAIHPKRPKAYLPHIRSKIKAHQGAGSIFSHISTCTLLPKTDDDPKRRTSMSLDSFNGLAVVNNPWEIAISPDGTTMYIVYAGTNDMNIVRILNDDYKEIEAIGRLIRVGQNPRAVKVTPDGKHVIINNTLDFNVAIYNARTMRMEGKPITVCKPPKSPEWVRGKALFNTALGPMTRQRWISCFSCHPDGQMDGRTWNNPEGRRNTQSMMGMAHTHPLHWSADRDEVQDFEYTIRGKLMQGYGLFRGRITPKRGYQPTELSEVLSNRSKDLDALAIYSNSFRHTLSPHIPAKGKLSESASRGKELFFSKKVGCAECHSGPHYSDSSLKKPFRKYDVGTSKDDPFEKMGSKFDTPSLLRVYRTAPYLHDGQAKTLEEVLTKFNPEDKHGKTSHLKPAQIQDLVAFLKSLPYELPPEETPNTVRYRLTKKNIEQKE